MYPVVTLDSRLNMLMRSDDVRSRVAEAGARKPNLTKVNIMTGISLDISRMAEVRILPSPFHMLLLNRLCYELCDVENAGVSVV